MIKAITFDLDGVYFSKGKKEFMANLINLGVTKEKAEEVFFGDKMNKEYKLGKLSDNEFWTWAIKEWKLDIAPDEIVDLMIKDYEVDKEVDNLVKK